jgi:hypothetical protein
MGTGLGDAQAKRAAELLGTLRAAEAAAMGRLEEAERVAKAPDASVEALSAWDAAVGAALAATYEHRGALRMLEAIGR